MLLFLQAASFWARGVRNPVSSELIMLLHRSCTLRQRVLRQMRRPKTAAAEPALTREP